MNAENISETDSESNNNIVTRSLFKIHACTYTKLGKRESR